ncbi:MAG: hypothetical protein V4550_17930 [Gemmatimonadota bacterium]
MNGNWNAVIADWSGVIADWSGVIGDWSAVEPLWTPVLHDSVCGNRSLTGANNVATGAALPCSAALSGATSVNCG